MLLSFMFVRWDEEVVVKANERHSSGEASPVISFECETLKADSEAEEHVKKFLPSLVGRDAVGEHAYSHFPFDGAKLLKCLKTCLKMFGNVM